LKEHHHQYPRRFKEVVFFALVFLGADLQLGLDSFFFLIDALSLSLSLSLSLIIMGGGVLPLIELPYMAATVALSVALVLLVCATGIVCGTD
jgi:hypothetical protein